MLTTQSESTAEASTTVVNLEKKIAEIKLYLANLHAAKSSVPVTTSAPWTTISADQENEQCSVELQITSPVESTSPFQLEQSSEAITASVAATVATAVTTKTTLTSVGKTNGDVSPTSPVAATDAPVEMVSMPKLDNFIGKLDKFAAVLSEKARSHPVVIGKIDEIDSAAQMKKV